MVMKNIIFVVLAVLIVSACVQSSVEKEVIYVPVKDTISDNSNVIRIVNLERELQLTRDSLNSVRDSIGEDLFVARYKLARIKYYNNIAAKGNNIKFLRGWINRVLNE
jgi:hypothetical protein